MANGSVTRLSGAPGQAPDSADHVLMSKITVHSRPDWAIPRPRIDLLLTEGTRGPLTVVTGPPGAGKTMAIASWAATRTGQGPLAWLTVDEYDNRPQVFWSYVVAALRRADIPVPQAWPTAAGGDADSHVFLQRLASALAAAGPPVTLVVEDLHLLTDAETIDGLAYVLKSAAPALRLVISSRIDPPLPLHKYRLSGELSEIRAEDLTLSLPETRLILAQHGISLSAEALKSLSGRTEGWAAGIRLAAISLQGHPDPEQFVKELGTEDNAVTSYLVEEVLNAQPASLRAFLLRTSILDRVNADIARELIDEKQESDVLPALARANAFVRPLGHGWYRYHPLFAAILRLKLRRESPSQLSDLRGRAARWYLRNGSLTEAVRQARASGDWLSAARMVVGQLEIGKLIEPRGSQLLADEFRRMPKDATQSEPLLVTAALELRSASGATASTSLSAAENILEQLPAADEVPARLAAALIRTALGRQTGNLEVATTASVRAEALVGEVPGAVLAAHPELRVQALLGRGVVQFWAGEPAAAAVSFAEGIAFSGSAHTQQEADCLAHLALVEALQGRLSRAAELASEATGGAEEGDDTRPAATSAACIALACVHLERNELTRVHEQLIMADAALKVQPDRLLSALASLLAARRFLAEGRARSALAYIGRAGHGWSPPAWLLRQLAVAESQAWTASGNLQSAIDAAGRAGAPSTPEVAAALAHAWLAAGDHPSARRALAAAVTGSGDQQERERLAGWLVDARLSYAEGDASGGRRSLERALELGRPEQLRLPFAMERAWIRPLLRRHPDLTRDYRDVLGPGLTDTGQDPAGQLATPEAMPLVVDELSQREHEVLQHLSEMHSTVEIAAEMYISVNTVKTHLKSIYRKLSAAHRSEAVRRARQLKLL
jgi:LuxR family transcriptional regulator, maltose regulon positive regulatory protein